jgi:DNA repair exonuclease SbcCD ATPase subunit
MSERMKKLSIQGFRGATQPLDLLFDDHKSVIMIFGENGTGKSTIVDAIESVVAGSTAFLDNWKLGKGKRKESFMPSLGKSLQDVKISLNFGINTYTASLNAKGLQLCATPARPLTKILRRKSLQAFIDAEPAQRYKEVASFLDIPQIEAAEASLRDALREAEKRFESATSACSHALESMQGLWEAEGSPGLDKKQNAQVWAQSQAATPEETLQQTLATLKTGVRHCENLQNQMQASKEAQEELAIAEKALTDATNQLAAWSK